MAFEIEVEHPGLGKRVVVRARTLQEAQWKAQETAQRWNAQFDRQLAVEARRQLADDLRASKEATRDEALRLTTDAAEELAKYERLLSNIIALPPFDANDMRFPSKFDLRKPASPDLEASLEMPSRSEGRFQPKLGLFDRIFSSLRDKKIREKDAYFVETIENWEKNCSRIKARNDQKLESYSAQVLKWESQRAEHEQRVAERGSYVDSMLEGVGRGERVSVEALLGNALATVSLPSSFSGEFDVTYVPESKTVVVDIRAPSLNEIELMREFKYISTKNEIKEVPLKRSDLQSLFDSAIYQLCLGIPHFVLKCISEENIDIVVCNAWVEYLNSSTGNEVVSCVASLQVGRSDFDSINLSKVDPKACFRSLKGVSAPQIHTLTPVRPILQLDKDDARFVESHGVIDGMETGTNIAAIGWEEFEHLIREVFEKEFSSSGGEVKVTQASRDGGVDAVAFDPDPIRGGKIVIQAKRYTNTVGVGAVRDLFGTVVSEGATKGILVTTSGFGPDAYAFAKGKPLTLLEGSHLLHLLGKHGHSAKIDLIEAKRLGASMNR